MKESGGHCIKEGGNEIIDSIQRILKAGIPVMGHLGLTPQSIYDLEHTLSELKKQNQKNN